MNPPPLSLASKCPVVAGREVAPLLLSWLDVFIGSPCVLGLMRRLLLPKTALIYLHLP